LEKRKDDKHGVKISPHIHQLYAHMCLYNNIFPTFLLHALKHVGRMWRVWSRGEACAGFWWGNLRERDHWGDPDADGRIILRWIFRRCEGVVWPGWSWFRIGTGGGHL